MKREPTRKNGKWLYHKPKPWQWTTFSCLIYCVTPQLTQLSHQHRLKWWKFFLSRHPFPYIILLWNKVPWCSTRGDMPLYCVPTCECETTVTEAKINLKSEMTVAVEMGDMIVELIWKHCPLFGHIVNVFLFISLFITLTDSSVYWFVMGFRSVSPHFQNSKKWPCSEYWIL